ncbi:MAG TPA: hypothetical protein VKR80_00910 [Candidatus Limnocylindria bacterium]|nr:hypothetical protein [Candidatus Limnocylindria bacterium]
MGEERSADPLTAFISRSLRAEVSDVREEILQDTTDAELDRVHFTQDGAARTLIVKRVPPHASLEVKLLPHLARKTDRVPAVFARGIPPVTVPAWPWLLIEDLLDAPAATDLAEIVRAKVAVERAVAADGPALVALGVPRIARRGALAAWPEVLVHGALGGRNAVSADRGVVLAEWRQASLGAGLVDVARLARDRQVPAGGLAELYARETGVALSAEALGAAEELVS